MLARYPVQEIAVNEYVENFMENLRTVRERVNAMMQDAMAEAEMAQSGAEHRELRVGDLVLKRFGPQQMRGHAQETPLRFSRNTHPEVLRVVARVGKQPFTYRVVDHIEPAKRLSYDPLVSRRFLVKLDMPELKIDTIGQRRIEVWNKDEEAWEAGTVESVALDGRALVRFDERPEAREDVVLAERRDRWNVDGAVREWADVTHESDR